VEAAHDCVRHVVAAVFAVKVAASHDEERGRRLDHHATDVLRVAADDTAVTPLIDLETQREEPGNLGAQSRSVVLALAPVGESLCGLSAAPLSVIVHGPRRSTPYGDARECANDNEMTMRGERTAYDGFMKGARLRSRLSEAKEQLTEAETELGKTLRAIRSGPRAHKTTISKVVEDAFIKLKAAKAKLSELEKLLASESV
jgi:hypothetical protein